MHGVKTQKTLDNVVYEHVDFRKKVEAAIEVQLAETPDGFREPQISDRLKPSTDRDRKAIRNELKQMVTLNYLEKGERGIFHGGLHMGEVDDRRRLSLEADAMKVMSYEGGWMSRTDILINLGRDPAHSDIGAVEGMLSRSLNILRARPGLYHLSNELRENMVAEGRWMREEISTALARLAITEYEELSIGSKDDPRLAVTQEFIDERCMVVGLTISRLRRAQGLPSDEAAGWVGAALSESLSQNVRAQDWWAETCRTDGQKAALEAAYDLLEEGDTRVHESLRTAVYTSLGRLLHVDPVALSRGCVVRAVADTFLANTHRRHSGEMDAKKQEANRRANQRRRGADVEIVTDSRWGKTWHTKREHEK